MPRHTLSVLVENTPGVLSRITALFSRRGFNIDSVTEGRTEHPAFSRLTLVVHAEPEALEQVAKQVGKLVNVLKVIELPPDSTLQRELVLVKVHSEGRTLSHITEIVQLFRAKAVDVSPEAVTIEASGTTEKLEAMLRMLEQFGITELVRSGTIAIGRGPNSSSSSLVRRIDHAA
ncbi:acetolactate synthase small subunit [Streptomyces violascens]|uniref:acetolactate synthase small subunit n=1 Tax=Streptomyces violascens TaxID=67381 RepID=UPI0037A5654B